jgi:cytochrome c5
MKTQKANNASTLFLTLVLGFGFLLNASQTLAADTSKDGDAARGGKIWAETCNRCHNMRSPTDLTDEQWVASVSHMRVRASLTGQQARDVLAFLQSANGIANVSSKATPMAMTVADSGELDAAGMGQSVYEASCIACHGANGQGAFPGVPDFTSAEGPLSKSNDTLLRNVVNGFQSPGSPMPMPPRGGNGQLTDVELSATIQYIKQTFQP